MGSKITLNNATSEEFLIECIDDVGSILIKENNLTYKVL